MNNIKRNPCRISVIMPACNAGKFVSEAIQSILNQSFPDFEFIIIDDSSTDDTWEIIQSFKDNRIIALQNPRKIGQYPTRNRGIQMSKGKYIAMMDADVIALPDRLLQQYTFMENNPHISASATHCNNGIPAVANIYEEIPAALLSDNCISHPSLFIHSEIIKKLNGYNENYLHSSDYDLICRISLIGKIVNLPEACISHHPAQISQEKSSEQSIYTDIIRQKYQIAFINKYKSPQCPEAGEAETGCPDTGRLIALYIMGKRFNPSFSEQADKLLEEIINKIDTSTPLRIKKGLLGFGAGVIYLLRNHLIEGDEDDYLEPIDAVVSHSIIYFDEYGDFDWCGTGYYLRKRALMPGRKQSIIQLRIKNLILHLLDIYKQHPRNLRNFDRDEELNRFCENDLFKHLTTVILKNGNGAINIPNREIVKNSETITFLIPVRIDSEERRSNLLVILDQLLAVDNSDIIILEADKKSGLEQQNFCSRIQHHFIKDTDPVFHKAKYINQLLKMAKSPVVGVWDADVFAPKSQIEQSIEQIKAGNVMMSIPFDGRCYYLLPELSDEYRTKGAFSVFDEQKKKLNLFSGIHTTGGAYLVNKDVYCSIGGENEHFYGWSDEDAERLNRMEIMGYRLHKASGALYHLFHPRNNSHYANPAIELNSLEELIKVSEMSPERLATYINTWEWL